MATADDYAKWIVDNADKQGTEEFTTVAAAYQEAKQEEAQQQQQQPVDRTAPGNQPAFAMGGYVPKTPEEAQQYAKGMGTLGSGIAEGAKEFWAGLKQRGAGVQDAYNWFVHGSEAAAARGAGEKEKEAIATELIRQQNAAEQAKDDGIASPVYSAGKFIGQYAPLSVAPEAAGPRATGVLSAAGRNMLTGAAGGFLEFDAKKDSLYNTTAGALAGPALGFVQSLAPAGLNAIGRSMTRAIDSGYTKKVYENARQLFGDNVKFSLSQIAGVPELDVLERKAYGSEMVKFYADQDVALHNQWDNIFIAGGRDQANLGGDLAKTQVMASRTLKDMKSNAIAQWDSGMARAVKMEEDIVPSSDMPDYGPTTIVGEGELADRSASREVVPRDDVFGNRPGPYGVEGVAPGKQLQNFGAFYTNFRGRAAIPVDNLKTVLGKWVQESSDPVVRGASGEVKSQIKAMSSLLNQKTISAADLDRVLRGLTSLGKKDGGKAAATQLRKALDYDLDLLSTNGSTPQNEVVAQILQTRNNYKQAMLDIATKQRGAAYKLLGVPDNADKVSGQQLLNNFRGMPEGDQRGVRAFLDDNAPDLRESMKQAVAQEASKNASVLRAARDAPVSAESLVDDMFGQMSSPKTVGLWTADELKKMTQFRDAVRIVMNTRPGGSGVMRGSGITLEDTAINAVSRHSGFMARYLMRAIQSSKGWKVFTDQDILAKITKINRSTTGSPTNLMARAALLDYLQTDYAETEQQKQQQQPQQ